MWLGIRRKNWSSQWHEITDFNYNLEGLTRKNFTYIEDENLEDLSRRNWQENITHDVHGK